MNSCDFTQTLHMLCSVQKEDEEEEDEDRSGKWEMITSSSTIHTVISLVVVDTKSEWLTECNVWFHLASHKMPYGLLWINVIYWNLITSNILWCAPPHSLKLKSKPFMVWQHTEYRNEIWQHTVSEQRAVKWINEPRTHGKWISAKWK